MSEPPDIPSEDVPLPPVPNPNDVHGVYTEQLRHDPIGARVPESRAAGSFATGAIVHEGPNEFVIDFIQGMVRPPRVEARVVLSAPTMAQFVGALRDNIAHYEQAFGPAKPVPKPNLQRRPTVRELYEEIKVPDDRLSGSYATSVMIGHSPAEFFFDFITRFFPTAAVSARVFMSASQVTRFVETLAITLQNHQRRVQNPPAAPPPAPQPPSDSQ